MKAIIIFSLIMINATMVTAQKQEITVNHIALYVEDLARSVAFYKNIIGLDTVPEPFKDGMHAWFAIGGGLTLHIIQGKKEKVEQYRNTHTCYSVAEMDAFVKHLVSSGIIYEDVKGNPGSITTRVDGMKQIYFKDPDGYWIEVNNDKGK
jgi:lactoylglutathione lyase